MSDSRELASRGQQSLDDQLFSRFINLKVGLSLSGTQQFPAEELVDLAGKGRFEKGREVTVTARFFVADTGLGVTRSVEYGGDDRYGFGSGKVALKLIAIESLQIGEQKLAGQVAKLCSCAVRRNGASTHGSTPEGYRPSDAKGWLGRLDCEVCDGRGLLYPQKYDAPHAPNLYRGYEPTLILVDELPEPEPVPEGHCSLCAEKLPRHHYECPESDYNRRRAEAEYQDATDVEIEPADELE